MKGSPVLPAVVAFAAAAGLVLVLTGPEADPPGPVDDVPIAELRGGEWHGTQSVATLARYLVAREVAAGKWSLPQAAALFIALNRVPPEVDLTRLPAFWEDRTAAEQVCRQLIGFVDYQSGPDVSRRLWAEFDALRRHGPIRLPDPESLEPIAALLARAKAELTPAQQRDLFGPGHDGTGGPERSGAGQ